MMPNKEFRPSSVDPTVKLPDQISDTLDDLSAAVIVGAIRFLFAHANRWDAAFTRDRFIGWLYSREPKLYEPYARAVYGLVHEDRVTLIRQKLNDLAADGYLESRSGGETYTIQRRIADILEASVDRPIA